MSLVKTEWEIREITKPHNYYTVSQISSVMKSEKSKYESIHRNYSQPLIAVMQRYDYMHHNHDVSIVSELHTLFKKKKESFKTKIFKHGFSQRRILKDHKINRLNLYG